MLHELARDWWVLLLNGLGIASGVMVLAWPGITLWALLILMISLFSVFHGILLVSLAFKLRRFSHEHKHRKTTVMRGV